MTMMKPATTARQIVNTYLEDERSDRAPRPLSPMWASLVDAFGEEEADLLLWMACSSDQGDERRSIRLNHVIDARIRREQAEAAGQV